VKYVCLLAVLGAAAIVLVPQATARQHASKHGTRSDPAEMARLMSGIVDRRDETWRWQRLMHRSRTPYSGAATRIPSVHYRRWVYRLWDDRATKAKTQALSPPHRPQWMCIHHYEGSWKDPNAPYYGGLQMDREFQSTYGPELLRAKGTADHWTPLEQMWVAERAYRERGFWPWPNTARYCGLL
jgi:cytochrome c peroxidase